MIRLNKKKFFQVFFIILALLGLSAADIYQEENGGDIKRGAYLYKEWDQMLRVNLYGNFNPIWSEYSKDKTNAPQTWRCVSCHGWNYLGTEFDEQVKKSIPGLIQVKDMSQEEIQSWLDGSINPKHNFSKYFTVAAQKDLIAFLQYGIIDYSPYISREVFDQSNVSRNGEDLYKQSCRNCHGSDGSLINIGPEDNPIYLGNVAEEPWQVVHVLQFGHINVQNTSRVELDWSLQDVFDVVNYSSILPKGQPLGEDPSQIKAVDYSEQADTAYMVYVAVMMVAIVFFAFILSKYHDAGVKTE